MQQRDLKLNMSSEKMLNAHYETILNETAEVSLVTHSGKQQTVSGHRLVRAGSRWEPRHKCVRHAECCAVSCLQALDGRFTPGELCP